MENATFFGSMRLPDLSEWASDALARARISQAEFSRRMVKDYRLATIDRAAANKMLSGKRGISAEEMLAIEHMTGVPAPSLVKPVIPVPLLSWVSAGDLADAESQIPVEDVPLLAFADLGRGDFFALRVQGDSMDRLSPDGSVIVVNRADRELVPDKPYVFWHKTEGTTFKLWQPEPPHLAPFSTNPMHKPIFLKGKRDLVVVGRVRRTVLDL